MPALPAQVLTQAARRSKAKMATGEHEPTCLLDFWSLQVRSVRIVRGVRARVEACAACGRAQRAGKHATGPCATILRPRSACLTWIEWCGRNLGTWRAPQVLKECEECEEQGLPPPFYASDAKMADSVMDFLFASQVRAWHAQHHSVCGT